MHEKAPSSGLLPKVPIGHEIHPCCHINSFTDADRRMDFGFRSKASLLVGQTAVAAMQ
jgi:hypothetical protein